jgi:hypothetical protein
LRVVRDEATVVIHPVAKLGSFPATQFLELEHAFPGLISIFAIREFGQKLKVTLVGVLPFGQFPRFLLSAAGRE